MQELRALQAAARAHTRRVARLDRYLLGRGSEQKQEQPLVRADGAAYVHYQKGALTLYQLQDTIGEAAMNDALASFVRRWRFAGPPYPRSVDLLQELRRVTPPAQQPLIADLFEAITLYDVRAIDAVATRRTDGRHDVEVHLAAKKLHADGAGNETEVPSACSTRRATCWRSASTCCVRATTACAWSSRACPHRPGSIRCTS